jgi:zinc/manganese transport system substrate-binding protein
VPLRHLALLLAALLAAGATGCASEPGAAPAGAVAEGPLVVATTTILADLVSQLLGDAGHVESLMGPGQDPHGFSPSARQAERLRRADLVVANGLGLEEGVGDAIAAAEAAGVPVVRVAEEVDVLPPGGESVHDHEDVHDSEDGGDEAEDPEGDDGHDHGEGDPHVWFDPVRTAEGMRAVGAALADLDPAGDWDARTDALVDDLTTLDAEIAELLAPVPERCRQLVTNHDNLGYLAARYDLEVIGTVLPGTSASADPSARAFAELVELLRRTGVPAVFVDTTVATRPAEVLTSEVGRDVAVVELYTDALGEPGSGADTYAGMLTTDARRIADALADCGPRGETP